MKQQETEQRTGQFLPITRQEMLDRGWDQVDFAYVIADA